MRKPDPLAEQVMRNENDRIARARKRKPSVRPKARGKEMPWNEDHDFSEMRLYLCDSVREKLSGRAGREDETKS